MKKISLILISILLILTLAACGNKCEHTYDNACDATCNECGETREVSAHQWKDADCITPKTCKTCGLTEGSALGHTPAEDDGDCTTDVICTVCGEVTTSAKTNHIAHADDGDCTTPVTCTECSTVLTEAKSHDFTGEYESDETQHWHVCKNEGCNATDEKKNHTPDRDAATTTAPKKCTECDHIIEPQLPHDCSYTVQDKDATHHWMECTCGAIDESTKVAHSVTPDNDCATAEICDCGYTVTAAKDHIPGADDGNCTTSIKCANCEQLATSGNTNHTDADHDYTCDNLGCQVSVGAPEDKNDGIDLPIDRN